MADDDKDEKEKVKDETKDEPKDDDGSKSATIEDVKRIVHEAFQTLTAGGNSDGDGDTKDEKNDPRTRGSGRMSFAQAEEFAAQKVADAVKMAGLERDLGEIKTKLEKPEVEKPPKKVRRSTRFWLGSYADND